MSTSDQTVRRPTHSRRSWAIALLAVVVVGAGIAVGVLVSTGGSSSSPDASARPCDTYDRAHTPCVAAYSSVRALYADYAGPLYQVQRASDGAKADVRVESTGGYANAATQDHFCAHTSCTITTIYDQSPRHNDLTVAGPGHAGPQNSPAPATALPVTVDGHDAYGIQLPPHVGYRHRLASGTARDGQPESMYEVASGTFVNDKCCSDFGNVEADEVDTGASHMDAVTVSRLKAEGPRDGPWVQADLENGVWEGGTKVTTANRGNSSAFVTALLKNNGRDHFALKGGNAQHGGLSTWYDGALPARYSPMHQEGSIVLGTGGDNSNRGRGRFFEGVLTAGYSSDAADDAVQANIASVGYRMR